MGWESLIAPILGGLLGSQKEKTTETATKSMDPRLDPYIYGSGGLIPSAYSWFDQNRSGLNQQMVEGLNTIYGQNKASKQGFDMMQNRGMELMGGPIAGNPFTRGYSGGTDFSTPQGSASTSTATAAYTPAAAASSSGPYTMPTTAPAQGVPSTADPYAALQSLLGGYADRGGGNDGSNSQSLLGNFTDAQMADNAKRLNDALQSYYDSSGMGQVSGWLGGLFGPNTSGYANQYQYGGPSDYGRGGSNDGSNWGGNADGYGNDPGFSGPR
jgi:hypothetical protein